MEVALYHPESGYYSGTVSPVGRGGDYITSSLLSPAFAFALSRLVREFVNRAGDEPSTIVDIGCGDGSLINDLAVGARELGRDDLRFFGVDRAIGRVSDAFRENVTFVRTIDEVPRRGPELVLSNELYDAIPFARLVMRQDHLHELCVTGREDGLDWAEREAAAEYEHYFTSRGIELPPGQFADVSLEWELFHADVCRRVERGLVVTFDYGYPESKLFHSRARRFGTAAAYAGHRVSRDLLASPGKQDLTAHINFTDLERAGERAGLATLFFERQARFLLALGITEHELFTPSTDLQIGSVDEGVALLERRDAARQLVLPDGIGHDLRVLVQGSGMGPEPWGFQRAKF